MKNPRTNIKAKIGNNSLTILILYTAPKINVIQFGIFAKKQTQNTHI